jgi:hypothetical protein
MKKLFRLLMVPSLLCAFALGQAQEKVLWSFAGYPTDGAQPADKLILDSAGNLYGTTQWGGTNANIYCTGCGTVFELSPGSSGSWTETILYNFCQSFDGNVCLDGAAPSAGLIFDQAGNLYGTTRAGGQPLIQEWRTGTCRTCRLSQVYASGSGVIRANS